MKENYYREIYFFLETTEDTRLNSKCALIGWCIIIIILSKVYYIVVLHDACRFATYYDAIISLKVITEHWGICRTALIRSYVSWGWDIHAYSDEWGIVLQLIRIVIYLFRNLNLVAIEVRILIYIELSFSCSSVCVWKRRMSENRALRRIFEPTR
jgi:hypothetical protein